MHRPNAEGGAGAAGRRDGQGHADHPHAQGAAPEAAQTGGDPMKRIVLAALALAACSTGAQQVYRCGSSYSQQPCPGGTAVETMPNGTTSQDAAKARANALGD